MILRDLQRVVTGDYAQISAKAIWEHAGRPERTIYFSVSTRYAEYLQESYDPFLVAALVPAMRNGESRIRVEGDVCPHLMDNLYEAMGWLYGWYEYSGPPLSIEATKRDNHNWMHPVQPRSAIFLSGGVDSLSCLSHNLSHYPQDDPLRVSAGVYVYGFDVGGQEPTFDSPKALATLAGVEKVLAPLCDKLHLDYIRIKTNIRHLDDTPGFWGEQFCGAAISACGQALGNHFTHFFLSSSGRKITKHNVFSPFGNHPVLDHNYSSERVHIQHYQCRLDSRLTRISIICNNADILDSVRVCFFPPEDQLNCERCEKCVRTKLGLYALGKLEQAKSFSAPLRAEDIRRVDISSDASYSNYVEIRALLREQNRTEFLDEIDKLLQRYKKWKAWKEETNLTGTIKRFDRRFLNGSLQNLLARQGRQILAMRRE